MTLGSALALVRTARKDGHEAISVEYGFAECLHYVVYVDGKQFNDTKQYAAWQRDQAAKEVQP